MKTAKFSTPNHGELKKTAAHPIKTPTPVSNTAVPAPVKTNNSPAKKPVATVKHEQANRKEHVPVTLKPAAVAGKEEKKLKQATPVEQNYPAHQQRPKAAPEAVLEEDKDGAGSALKWVIPVVVIALAALWYFMK